MIDVVVINNEDQLTIIMALDILDLIMDQETITVLDQIITDHDQITVLIMGQDPTTTDHAQTMVHEIIIVHLREIILDKVLLKHNRIKLTHKKIALNLSAIFLQHYFKVNAIKIINEIIFLTLDL
jgi:hypothetical protein